jgi:N-methylhydantoinase B
MATENAVDLSERAVNGDYDRVSAEILRKGLVNLTNEMALALINTSGSPVVFEVKDFCTCLLDTNGDHLSYSSYALLHAGMAMVGTKATIAQVERDGTEIRPGDAWLCNDPIRSGAAHQGDISVLTPVFHEGEHLGWCYTSMHVMDVGGTGISGYAPGARVIYDEGLLFPPTRAIVGGRIDPEWERFIANNVRIPMIVMSDIRSMMASNNVGQQKLDKVVDQFGLERFKEYCAINNDLTEATLRRRIERMRDGIYETSEWVEFDGHGGPDQLLELRCRMEVAGDELRFSFTGVPQAYAFVNANLGSICGCTMSVLLTTLAYGDLPFNAGMWRPLSFDIGEPGTIVNAQVPAAVSNGHCEVGGRVCRAVKDVLVQALSLSDDTELRGRVAGQPQDAFPIAGLAGLDQEGEPTIVFLLDTAVGAGGGAQTIHDGQDVYFLTSGTGAGLAQVETHEARQPILFLWRRLQPNSGGPGEHRGGQALDEAYMLRYSDALSGSATNSCSEVPPRGYGGGHPAGTGDYWPVYETNAEELMAAGRLAVDTELQGRELRVPSKTGQLDLARGDVLRLLSGGGGGLGDPLQRDPAKVAEDLRDAYITAGNAEAAYGVVLGADGTVDAEATASRRTDIRTQRIGGTPSAQQGRAASIGVSVELAGDDWACAYCGSALCSSAENWRESAASSESTVVDYFAHLEMPVRDRREDPPVMIAERCCPSCAGLLAVEVYPGGFAGFPSPVLDGRDLPPVSVQGVVPTPR